mgnify:CR=1 FL=1
MSQYALKILSACPKSLVDIATEFNAAAGVVLVDSKDGLKKATESWGGSKFNEAEHLEYLDWLDFLDRHNSVVKFLPKYDIRHATSDLNAVSRDLMIENSLIDFAIHSDSIEGKVPQSILKRFHQTKKVKQQKHNLLIPKKVAVDMKAKDLVEKMTPYAFDCTRFKIIDPWIFEFVQWRHINGGAKFIQETQKKINFLLELFNQIECHSSYQPDDIKIEVYGRSYCYPKGSGRSIDIDRNDIIAGLSKVHELYKLLSKYDTEFIGLDDKHPATLDFHERFFYTDKFIFQIEKSFEEKTSGKQLLFFAVQQERDDLRKRFATTGDYYSTDFRINARELLRHRKTIKVF